MTSLPGNKRHIAVGSQQFLCLTTRFMSTLTPCRLPLTYLLTYLLLYTTAAYHWDIMITCHTGSTQQHSLCEKDGKITTPQMQKVMIRPTITISPSHMARARAREAWEFLAVGARTSRCVPPTCHGLPGQNTLHSAIPASEQKQMKRKSATPPTRTYITRAQRPMDGCQDMGHLYVVYQE